MFSHYFFFCSVDFVLQDVYKRQSAVSVGPFKVIRERVNNSTAWIEQKNELQLIRVGLVVDVIGFSAIAM